MISLYFSVSCLNRQYTRATIGDRRTFFLCSEASLHSGSEKKKVLLYPMNSHMAQLGISTKIIGKKNDEIPMISS